MKTEAERLLRYTTWANDKLFSHVQALGNLSERVLGALGHISRAEEIWWLRLLGESPGTDPVWPSWTVATSNERRVAAEQGLLRYVSTADESHFSKIIEYRSTKGEIFQTPMFEIITHLAMHSGYHRGQIMESLRQADLATTNTDYIAFCRANPI